MKFDKEKAKRYMKEIEQAEKMKQESIKDLLCNPERLKAIILKIISSEFTFIEADGCLHSELPITQDEFQSAFNAIMEFLSIMGKTYNKQDFDNEAHFPSCSGHLIFGTYVITVEEIYGQGTAANMLVEPLSTILNLDIPRITFSELESKGAKAYRLKNEILNRYRAIEAIQASEESLDNLLESDESKVIGKMMKLKLLSAKDAMQREISNIKSEIEEMLN